MNLIGTQEAAKRLKVSQRRVAALIEAGRLKATKMGNMWLIDPADLQAVMIRTPGRRPKDKNR